MSTASGRDAVLHVAAPISRLFERPVTVKTLEHPQLEMYSIDVGFKSVPPDEGFRANMTDMETIAGWYFLI